MNSKFFGQPNGPRPDPPQATLAFDSLKGEGKKQHVSSEAPNTETEVDGDGDVKMASAVKLQPGSVKTDWTKNAGARNPPIARDHDASPKKSPKRSTRELEAGNVDIDEEPVKKRSRRGDATKKNQKPPAALSKLSTKNPHEGEDAKKSCRIDASSTPSRDPASKREGTKSKQTDSKKVIPYPEPAKPIQSINHDAASDVEDVDAASSLASEEPAESDDEEPPEVAAKAREKVQSTLKSSGKDLYPDWKHGEPVPYAALCTTFSLIEMTTKRLIISSHCSLFLRQVLRLTPQDLLPTVQLMINKLAADYAGIELGIGESLIMKAIGETTGRSLQIIKADQAEIGDLGLVAAKSRSSQPTMFKPKALTIKGVLDGLMSIATVSGDGSQGRKVAGIKKLLSSADVALAGKGSKIVDITKDKGGASETKFIIRFLEGKLRLGLAEKTVLVALAHAMVIHETEKKGKKLPSSEQLAKGEAILKTVYR